MSNKANRQSGPLTKQEMDEYAKEQEAALNQPKPTETEEESVATLELMEPDPASNEALLVEFNTLKKRYSDLKDSVDTRIHTERTEKERIARELAELKQSKSKSNKKYAEQGDVEKFEKEVEVTPVLKQLMANIANESKDELRAEIRKELEADKAVELKGYQDRLKLTRAHPDWETLQHEKVFLTWLENQSEYVKGLADYRSTQNMDSVITVLDMFKAQVKFVKPSGPTKRTLSQNPVTNSRADIPATTEGKMSYNKWEKEFDKATKLGFRDKADKLMAEMLLAKDEGRLTL